MEYLWNDHEDCLNQRKISYKPCDETGHPILILTESQKSQNIGIPLYKEEVLRCLQKGKFRFFP